MACTCIEKKSHLRLKESGKFKNSKIQMEMDKVTVGKLYKNIPMEIGTMVIYKDFDEVYLVKQVAEEDEKYSSLSIFKAKINDEVELRDAIRKVVMRNKGNVNEIDYYTMRLVESIMEQLKNYEGWM